MKKNFGYVVTFIWAICSALAFLLEQDTAGFNFALLGVITLLLTLF